MAAFFPCFYPLIFCALSAASAELAAPAPDEAPKAKVVMVRDPAATAAFSPRPANIRSMVERGLVQVTSKSSPTEAWLSLISTQDIVGLKVFSGPGRTGGTRPEVAAAVIEGLLNSGLPAGQIIVWDKHRDDLLGAGFFSLQTRYGVQVESAAGAGYDTNNTNTVYDSPLLGNLVYGDVEFGQKGAGMGRRSFVSKLVTSRMTKIVQITPLLNHNQAGVSGNLFGLAVGSVDNTLRFEYDRGRMAEAVPEIYALPVLGDRVVLNIVDALFCQYEGGANPLLHYSTALNELRFSTDPVALDILSIEELDRRRKMAGFIPLKRNFELYRNASLLELGVSDRPRIQVIHVP